MQRVGTKQATIILQLEPLCLLQGCRCVAHGACSHCHLPYSQAQASQSEAFGSSTSASPNNQTQCLGSTSIYSNYGDRSTHAQIQQEEGRKNKNNDEGRTTTTTAAATTNQPTNNNERRRTTNNKQPTATSSERATINQQQQQQ